MGSVTGTGRRTDMSGNGGKDGTTFGQRLKALREAAGLTQQQLADRSGLHLGAVFKLEQGKRSPSWDTVQSLCRGLGVRCEAFEGTAADAPGEAPEAPPTAKGRRGGSATPDAPGAKPAKRRGGRKAKE